MAVRLLQSDQDGSADGLATMSSIIRTDHFDGLDLCGVAVAAEELSGRIESHYPAFVVVLVFALKAKQIGVFESYKWPWRRLD